MPNSIDSKLQTPYQITNYQRQIALPNSVNCRPRGKPITYDETDLLNSKEIYETLKKTSDEIQNYSFNLDAADNPKSPSQSKQITPPVQKSSLMQNYMNNLAAGMQAMKVSSPPQRNGNGSSESGDSGVSQLDNYVRSTIAQFQDHSPQQQQQVNGNGRSPQTPSPPKTNGHSNSDEDAALIESLLIPANSANHYQYQGNLVELARFIADLEPDMVRAKFKNIYRNVWLRYDQEIDVQSKILLLRIIGQLLLKCPFEEHIELTLLKLLSVCKEADKEILKDADEMVQSVVPSLDVVKSFKIVKPYINHSDSATNVAAIKIMTKVFNSHLIVVSFFNNISPCRSSKRNRVM